MSSTCPEVFTTYWLYKLGPVLQGMPPAPLTAWFRLCIYLIVMSGWPDTSLSGRWCRLTLLIYIWLYSGNAYEVFSSDRVQYWMHVFACLYSVGNHHLPMLFQGLRRCHISNTIVRNNFVWVPLYMLRNGVSWHGDLGKYPTFYLTSEVSFFRLQQNSAWLMTRNIYKSLSPPYSSTTHMPLSIPFVFHHRRQ